MSESNRGVLFFAPRVLTIVFALFMSVFAPDVPGETKGVLQTLTALALHMMPALVVVGLLVLAWRWEWIGVIAFAGLAVSYIGVMWGRLPVGHLCHDLGSPDAHRRAVSSFVAATATRAEKRTPTGWRRLIVGQVLAAAVVLE